MRWVKVFSDFVVDLFGFPTYLFTETIELLIKKIYQQMHFPWITELGLAADSNSEHESTIWLDNDLEHLEGAHRKIRNAIKNRNRTIEKFYQTKNEIINLFFLVDYWNEFYDT